MSSTIMKQRGRVDSVLMLASAGLLATVAGLGINMMQMSSGAAQDDQYRTIASDLRVLTQDINVEAREAFSGNQTAFTELAQSRQQFPVQLNMLSNGTEDLGAPGETMTAYVDAINEQWSTVGTGVDAILSAQDRILFVRDVSANLNTNIKTIQAHYADLVDILGGSNVSSETLLAAQQQLWLIERIGRNIDRILAGGSDASASAEEFKQDALKFQRNMEGMRDGDRARNIDRLRDSEAIETLNLAEQLYAGISGSVNDIYESHQGLIEAAQAAAAISTTTPTLIKINFCFST